jgi:hypothetical protein
MLNKMKSKRQNKSKKWKKISRLRLAGKTKRRRTISRCLKVERRVVLSPQKSH